MLRLGISAASQLNRLASVSSVGSDAAPIILSDDTASIAENSGANRVIYAAVATAPNPFTYSLGAGSDAAVSINANTGEVTLATNPDYETQAQYTFYVIATDIYGTASATKTVTLNIIDVNESSLNITSGTSVASIFENSGAGQVIYTVTANKSAVFSLSASSDDALTIDAATGDVILTTNPDHETQSQYNFAVIATDADGIASAPLDLLLIINNVDEVAPTITSGNTAATIFENSGDNQAVYTATAADTDTVSGSMTFSLSNDSDDALSINSSTGVVTLNENPNYAAKSQYNFSVIATDAAGNASAPHAVVLNIQEVVDSAPIITSPAAVYIDENSGAPQVVYQATTQGGGAVFSLGATSSSELTINSASGEITLTVDPDFESVPSYGFQLIASNSYGSTTKNCFLYINDLDEHAPVISSPVYFFADENVGANQVLATLTARDEDGITMGMTYYLNDQLQSDSFSLNSSTGELTLLENPDFETRDAYYFYAYAIDAAGNVGSQRISVLQIVNLDEIAPTITSSSSATITENTGAGQVVYAVTAVDSTEDIMASPITFSLGAGSDSALSINSATGEVTLSDNPVYAAKNQYAFTVVATDGGGNSAQQEVLLVVVASGNAAPATPLAYRRLVDSDGRCLYDANNQTLSTQNMDYTVGNINIKLGTL